MKKRSKNINDIETQFDGDFTKVFDLPDNGNLAVILCHFNPCLYSAPEKNLKRVLSWLTMHGLPTYAIELRCGKSLTQQPVLPNNSKVVHLTCDSTFFRKDNLWNILACQLPKKFEYILCLDADTILLGDDWVQQLKNSLKANKIVQPFTTGVWTDSLGNSFKEKPSCGYACQNGLDSPHSSEKYHSGFAIALHRSFWGETKGMFNSPVGGGSLFLMSACLGFSNELEFRLKAIAPHFLQYYNEWAKSVLNWSGGKLSSIDCEAWHLWHGSRKKRRYFERFERLYNFNPYSDLSFHLSGLEDWSNYARENKMQMIDDVEKYFSEREEDEYFDSTSNY